MTFYEVLVTVPDRGGSWEFSIGYFSTEEIARKHTTQYCKKVKILGYKIVPCGVIE